MVVILVMLDDGTLMHQRAVPPHVGCNLGRVNHDHDGNAVLSIPFEIGEILIRPGGKLTISIECVKD